MDEAKYPAKFYRGISSVSYYEQGFLLPDAFLLDPVREDGYCEISITWCDDMEAFEVIASQTKEDGTIQFKGGISEIERSELDMKMKPHLVNKNLSYERRPTPSNKYHGNLLILNSLNKSIKTMIRSQLALFGTQLVHENPYINGD